MNKKYNKYDHVFWIDQRSELLHCGFFIRNVDHRKKKSDPQVVVVPCNHAEGKYIKLSKLLKNIPAGYISNCIFKNFRHQQISRGKREWISR